MSAVDARWADDIIVVTMDDGSIRRYSDWNRYDTITFHYSLKIYSKKMLNYMFL